MGLVSRGVYAILSVGTVIALSLLLFPTQAAHAVLYQNGDVFIGLGKGKIGHYKSDGTFIENLATTVSSGENTGMCFDGTGDLYVTNWTVGKMTKFDNAGALLIHPWGLNPFSAHPEDCLVNMAGDVYAGEVDGANKLTKFDQAGNFIADWSPATQVRGMDWFDLAADQKTIFYTSEGSSIKRFDVSTPSGTQLADFKTGLSGPCYALRIRDNGEVMVACTNQVYQLDSSGVVLQTYTKASLGFSSSALLFAMNLDPDGTSFWTANYFNGKIVRAKISDGSVLTTFTVAPDVTSAGLAIFGELTVGGPQVVGGIALPIDTAALLLYGVQTSSMWWIPAIIIGVAGLLLWKDKKSKEKQKIKIKT